MTTITAVVCSKKNARLEIVLDGLESWQEFDRLARFVVSVLGAELIDAADGPDARRWIFRYQQRSFELRHDDMLGNTLFSPSAIDDELVTQLAAELVRRSAEL
jgi:hypothetical protein